MELRRTTSGSLAVALAAGGLVFLATPAQAYCSLVSYLPFRSGSTVYGYGGRLNSCSGSAEVSVKLRKQRNNLPDIDIATDTRTVKNGTWTADVQHNDRLTGRSRVQSSTGAMSESAWVTGL